MGWLGKRRRKKEEQEEPEAVVEAQESASTGTGMEVLVLVPEVAGAPTFRVNRFVNPDEAVAFIKSSITAEVFPSVHIFWAMHEGPPPDVGAAGGEALVLIRAGDNRDAVHVVSFVDLESAESFARFEVKRGLDLGFVLIYWAAFAQVIETPFGLRLDPPGPPDPRQWRAAAIAASHAAPAATPNRRRAAAMQAGDDYGPELRLMPETKLPEAPPRASREQEPLTPRVDEEPAEQPFVGEEPAAVVDLNPVETTAEEPAFAEQPAQEPEAPAEQPFETESGQPAPVESFEQPQEADTVDVVPADERTAVDDPTEEPRPEEVVQDDTPSEPEPAEEMVVHLEIPHEAPRDEEMASAPVADVGQDEVVVPTEFAAEPQEGSASGVEQADEEIVVPPEFAAEPEEAVASTNGHHAEERIPDDFRIDGPVTSSEGDEEVAERLLSEALGPEQSDPQPEPIFEAQTSEPADASAGSEAADGSAPAPEDAISPEPPAEKRKRKKAKAAASAKSGSKRATREDSDEDEEEIIPVDMNEVVEKTLRVKRWKKQEEPFKGFDSPPGRF